MKNSNTNDMNVIPQELHLMTGLSRPVFIFETEDKSVRFPVWINPQQTELLLMENEGPISEESTPHFLTHEILEALNYKVEHIKLTQVIGHHQYGELHLKGNRKKVKVPARLDRLVVFGLQKKCDFKADSQFIEDSRNLDLVLDDLEEFKLENMEIPPQEELL